MEEQQRNANVILEINNVQLHRLIRKARMPFTQGVFRLCVLDTKESIIPYFINLNSFYSTVTKSTVFIKVSYKKNISYCFPLQNDGFTTITINKNDEEALSKFEIIIKNIAVLINYQEAIQYPDIAKRIMLHCPDLYGRPIVIDDKFQRYISQGGVYAAEGLKWLGNLLGTKIKKIGNYFQNKIQPETDPELVLKKRRSWTELKQGTGKVYKVSNEFFSSLLNPVVAKGKQYAGKIKQKINSSESENVKYLTDIGSTAADAIGNVFTGFGNALTEVGSTVSSASGQLWDKKYGTQPVVISSHNESTQNVTQELPSESERIINQSIENNKL